jgi:hypothetical protein
MCGWEVMECENVKAQTKTRLLDIADVHPQAVSESLKAPEGKKRFSSFYEERASELAEYRADLANKCILMERRLNEEMACMFQSSYQMSSDEVRVSREYRMLDDEAARYLLAARQIIHLMDGYIQKISPELTQKSSELGGGYSSGD